MICVFGSFVIGDRSNVLKVFGLGLAAAILIDATLVRMVLVPSIMGAAGPGQLVDAGLAGPDRPHSRVEIDVTSPTESAAKTRLSVTDQAPATGRVEV